MWRGLLPDTVIHSLKCYDFKMTITLVNLLTILVLQFEIYKNSPVRLHYNDANQSDKYNYVGRIIYYITLYNGLLFHSCCNGTPSSSSRNSSLYYYVLRTISLIPVSR